MPSAAFLAWQAETATDRIILCDRQMAEQTSGDGWVSEGPTYPNTYSLSSFSNFIAASVVVGGVYRRIDKVRENATDYTSRASIALVDANASSWYYDEANLKLYVRTSTGSDPDTFSSIAVYFTIFAGTTVKDFDGGQLYEPMLTGELPVIDLEGEDILVGGVKILEEGNSDWNNAHKFWDTVSADYLWKNKIDTFYIGGGSLDFSDYEKVAVMRKEDLAVGDEICRARLTHMATILDKILPLNTMTSASYPRAGEGVIGAYKPMIYGPEADVPGEMVDTTLGANVWLLNDAAAFALTAVTNVRMVDINGVQNGLTETIHYTLDLNACTVTVTDQTYDQENYSLIADVTGDTDGAGGYLDTWAEQAKDAMLLLGEDSANIDASSFSTADTDGFQKTGLYMQEPKKASEYLKLLQRSVRGYLYIDREGQWAASVFLPPGMKGETEDSLSDEDYVTWEPEDKLETVHHEVVVKYDRNPHTGEWQEVSASDAQAEYELERSSVARIETALIDKSEATAQAQRWLMTLKQPSIQVQLDARGLGGLLKHPFERYLVTRDRAPDSAGSWTNEPCEIIEVQKTLAPPGVMLRIRKIGLSDRGDRIRWVAPSGILDYDSEDSADQEAYAFIGDSNGEVGAGNIARHTVLY